ncbi:MAG: tyrosine-type recombinase/integrase [Bacteroidota bacterium]|nr:tyrosine-type recombinase/integrase [Bacteroidota bacterium]
MYLSKDKSGIWYVYYRGEDGKTKRTSTRSKLKTDSLRFLLSFKTSKVVKPKVISFIDFKKEFLQFADVNYRKGTAKIFRLSLTMFEKIIGNLPLASITPLHWDKYKAERLKTITNGNPISPVTINIDLRSLRSAFNTALRWKLIESNPFSKQPFCSVPEQAPVFFTRADFQKLIDTVKEGWLKEMIIFATLTGMRRGEILNLQWSDIDLSRKTITIQSNLNFKTKQGKRRTIPLNDTAVYILQQKAIKTVTDYVFTLNGKPIFSDWLSHKFKFYVYECKFKEDRLHFHSLRHTFASWLVQDGVSLYEVQKLLGHSNIAVTQVYSHLQPEQLHNTVNKIQIPLN